MSEVKPDSKTSAHGSARRDKTRIVLTLLQIVLLPICVVISNNPTTEVLFAVATMALSLRLYLETLDL